MKNIFALVLAIAVLAVAGPVFAGALTANLNVSASVNGTCTWSAPTSIGFGVYDPAAATDKTATSVLSVTCTKGMAGVRVEGNDGLHPGAGTRRLQGAGATPDTLNYELYRDVNMTQKFGNFIAGDAIAVPPPTSSTVAQSFTIYGKLPKAQDVKTDVYTDTVIITLQF